jgi:hypothetical protein
MHPVAKISSPKSSKLFRYHDHKKMEFVTSIPPPHNYPNNNDLQLNIVYCIVFVCLSLTRPGPVYIHIHNIHGMTVLTERQYFVSKQHAQKQFLFCFLVVYFHHFNQSREYRKFKHFSRPSDTIQAFFQYFWVKTKNQALFIWKATFQDCANLVKQSYNKCNCESATVNCANMP